MGAALSSLDSRHLRIWNSLCAISSIESRYKMLDTLFSTPEYVNVAKHVGIYGELMHWRAAVQRGEPVHWPGVEIPTPSAPSIARSTTLTTVAPQKRALDYLHEAYDLLGLDDGAPLTMEALKIAYKKSALRAHPDKGGSPALFDAVSRAYTYIEEILNKLIPRAAGRATDAPVTMEQAVAYRATPVRPLSNTLSHHDGAPPSLRVEDAPPVSLNAKSLNMTVFNKLFDEHRLPNPDEDGYGDWLKSSGEEHSRKGVEELRTKFNADKFRSVFQEEIAAKPRAADVAMQKYRTPEALALRASGATEIGGGRPAHYTKHMGSDGLAYTDLKYAYSDGSTFSQEVADASIAAKSYHELEAERAGAPRELSAEEHAAVAAVQAAQQRAELERQRRLAAGDTNAERAYERLKGRLAISR
jgi:curved DNA-binding protein CbpA